MPSVYVIDQRKGKRQLLKLVFPIRRSRKSPEVERWVWPELEAKVSAIQGFGLYAKSGGEIDWSNLGVPVALPYLGKETEVESSVQARVLRSVLCGGFDVVTRGRLHTPPGYEWVQDGLYVTCMSKAELKKLPDAPPPVTNMEEKLLQVPIEPELSRAVSYVEEGDEQVCYLLYEETRELLHLPPHVFSLLEAHADDEHADRNMATHLVQFTRAQGVHLLVSAHPLFRHSAYIMGNANEPPKGAPSLELLELRLAPAADDDPLMLRAKVQQDQKALSLFQMFVDEHPEVAEKSTFFVSRKLSFGDGEELTVVYGSSYKRTYSTWGHAGTPLRYHVPHDQWDEGVWQGWARWPQRTPGWFNVDQQPANRPSFERGPTGSIQLLPDLPAIIKARKLGLDGDAHEQRVAKIATLGWATTKVSALPNEGEQEEFEMPNLEETQMAAGIVASLVGVSNKCRIYEASGVTPVTSTLSRLSFPEYPKIYDGGAMDALHDLVKREENHFRTRKALRQARGDSSDSDDDELTMEMPEWSTPWRSPLGSVVWCRMQGFPYWPAEVIPPDCGDTDIAMLRRDGAVFVKFFGWKEKQSHLWVPHTDLLEWDVGVEQFGLMANRCGKKARDQLYSRAKCEALAAIAARPGPPPPAPPPWWATKTWELELRGEAAQLLDDEMAALVAADRGNQGPEDSDSWKRWLEQVASWAQSVADTASSAVDPTALAYAPAESKTAARSPTKKRKATAEEGTPDAKRKLLAGRRPDPPPAEPRSARQRGEKQQLVQLAYGNGAPGIPKGTLSRATRDAPMVQHFIDPVPKADGAGEVVHSAGPTISSMFQQRKRGAPTAKAKE